MNPLLGRWISADPLAVHSPGEADLNVYAYVSGAVLKNVDPLGLEGETVHRLLVFKNEQLRNQDGPGNPGELHFKNMASLGRDWRAKGGGRLFETNADGYNGAVTGAQHAKAIGHVAKLGAEPGKTQHLHVVTHGGLSGVDKNGNPANAAIFLGSDGDRAMAISLEKLRNVEKLKETPDAFGNDAERASLRRMDAALTQLKADLKAGNVTELTIHGCSVGRSQEFLDTLSLRLGVKVNGFDGLVETRGRTDDYGNVEQGTAREGVQGRLGNDDGNGWVGSPAATMGQQGQLLKGNASSATSAPAVAASEKK